MSDQSDAPVSTEPSDHVVTIPPELPDHIVTISPSDRIFSFNIGEYPWDQLIAPQLCLSEHDEDEDTPASPGLRFPRRLWERIRWSFYPLESLANQRDPFWMNFDRLESQATQGEHDEDGATLISQSSRLFGRLPDTYGCLDADLRALRASQRSTFGLNPGSSFFNPGLQASQANQREHILMNSLANTFSFRQALQRAHQARRSVELMIGQVRMLESCVRFFEDFDNLALPRQQTREVWYDGWNGYGHPGDRYTVIGLISTISCAIYSILFGLTGQMYKEEDGSFFSHHRFMVTISMLSMVYAAFSGVFLCVIYYLATADPTHMYRRRMRFLSGTFVSAACFGPAVMFMAMFVGPLGFKVFAWAVLGAALTRVGFYIRGYMNFR